MKCPKCKTNQLKEKNYKEGQRILNQCTDCRGLWFDDGELGVVLGEKSADRFEIPRISFQNKNVCCPKCGEGLYEFCYPKTPIFIDMCKSCHGLWLDDKEWKEIAIARQEKDKIICPRCTNKQSKSTTCENCDLEFDKPRSTAEKGTFNKWKVYENSKSYADDMPGIKGTLLRFIDRSISNLTRY